jgi:putative intracellular protease/amidase
MKVLVPLPDRDFDTTEVAVPWRLLTTAGHSVVFATEAGAVAACDPLLLEGVLFGKLGADPEPRAFYAQMASSPEFRAPIRYDAIDPAAYAALVLPGGHAQGMKQYLESQALRARVAASSPRRSKWPRSATASSSFLARAAPAARASFTIAGRRVCRSGWSGRRTS